MTELLREEMGFDGLCVSDYGTINNAFMFQGIGETKEETGLLCLEAGMDMELPSVEGYGEAFKNLVCVRQGRYGHSGSGCKKSPDGKVSYGAV